MRIHKTKFPFRFKINVYTIIQFISSAVHQQKMQLPPICEVISCGLHLTSNALKYYHKWDTEKNGRPKQDSRKHTGLNSDKCELIMLPSLSLLPDKCDLLQAQQTAEGAAELKNISYICDPDKTGHLSAGNNVVLLTWGKYHRASRWKEFLIKCINL